MIGLAEQSAISEMDIVGYLWEGNPGRTAELGSGRQNPSQVYGKTPGRAIARPAVRSVSGYCESSLGLIATFVTVGGPTLSWLSVNDRHFFVEAQERVAAMSCSASSVGFWPIV